MRKGIPCLESAIPVDDESLRPGLHVRLLRTPSIAANARALILPMWVWALALVGALWGTFSANPTLSPAATILLPIGLELLWRREEPPILAFIYSIQWLQASVAIFHSDYYGLPLATFIGDHEAETAAWLSLIGIVALAGGMRLGLVISGHSSVPSKAMVNVQRIFRLYLISVVAFSIIDQVAWVVPGFAQPLLAVANLKWAIIFALFFSVFEQRQGYLLVLAAVALESAVGLVGYFASFKTVFFVLLIAIMTSKDPFGGRRLRLAVAVVLMVTLLGAIWTSIKTEYRDFMDKGTGTQQVLVPVQDRAEKLFDVTSDFSSGEFREGFEEMLFRISYIQYFSLTLMNVPSNVPYENGALWIGAVKHILMPRLLFPNKAEINDSDRTALYTGERVATAEEGTSIGIGYIGESYIDFGPIGMFAPILLLGLFYGLVYRFFIAATSFRFLGFALGVSLLLPAAQDFGASNIKILGGAITALIMALIVFRIAKRLLPDLARY